MPSRPVAIRLVIVIVLWTTAFWATPVLGLFYGVPITLLCTLFSIPPFVWLVLRWGRWRRRDLSS